jgi:hypothetical protein
MADALTLLNEFLGNLNLNFGNPIGLATNLVLSTIVGGIVILVIVEIFAKKFAEDVNPMHAFLLVLVVSLINILGVMSLLGSFLAIIPVLGILVVILPVLVWIVLVKLFFRDMEILHVLIIGVLGYFLSIYVIPSLISLVSGYIPL